MTVDVTTEETNVPRIRPAKRSMLQACVLMDGSYQTDHVWQLFRREDDAEVATAFRIVALPRVITVAYPPVGEELIARWEQGDCVLVAEWHGQCVGFIDITPMYEQGLAWVHHLIVARPVRRRGIGTALLQQAGKWASAYGLERMVFVLQSKNHPGIQFCRSFGFEFCGYNELYYGNQDIALFFGHDLK